MKLKVQPIVLLGRHGGVFPRSSGTQDFISTEEALQPIVRERLNELTVELSPIVELLRAKILRNEADVGALRKETLEGDALLVYVMGIMPIQEVLRIGLPVICFSGPQTPMLALDAFAEEKGRRKDLRIALDFQDIVDHCRVLAAQKQLRDTRIALVGFPSPWFSRWCRFTDPERVREVLGVELTPVELREFVESLQQVDTREAQVTAQKWVEEARETPEADESDIWEAAKVFLSLTRILERRKANALSLNCQEMIYAMNCPPPCYPLSRLRDENVAAACENDVPALLSMLILGYLSGKPAFIGNIVRADPAINRILLSHCVVPTKMAGFDQPSEPHMLRNYHGHDGVTSWVEMRNVGQEVTLGRLDRKLQYVALGRGRIMEYRDTVTCRTTFSIEMADVRQFVQNAPGNHFALVYGDWSAAMKALSQILDLKAIIV
ncbi:hypothetical protein ACFL0Q_02315 [Thermodesulfobacteriota bacterium]